MEEYNQPPQTPGTQPPPMGQPPMGQPLKPHRGTTVLVLGILGLVVCVICGIIAWVMGKNDLNEMDAGIMDPSGRGLTQAGKICGMISCILVLVGVAIWLVFVVIIGAAGIAAS